MQPQDQKISASFIDHYTGLVRKHGPTPEGTDWRLQSNAEFGYQKMLEVIQAGDHGRRVSFLDVGCGYGGLLAFAKERGIALDYTGIDIVADMIEHGKKLHPEARFRAGDFLDMEDIGQYDYVVCNGILTLKLASSMFDMTGYCHKLVRRMFGVARTGIAFNTMSNKVNYFSDNLFYQSPVEVLAFCFAELSSKVRLDHAYPRFEFTTYVYHS
jgi:SAM-dependent methyltransferase